MASVIFTSHSGARTTKAHDSCHRRQVRRAGCPAGVRHRPGDPGDGGELVRTCSPESLRRRFLGPAPLEPEAVLERYRRYLLAGPPEGAAAVALVRGTPVGLLNLVVVHDGEVEASLLVADAWQHRHIATQLLTVELGRPRWVGWTVCATVEPGNLPVRQLLARQRFGTCRLVGRDPSAWDYAVDLGDVAGPRGRQGPIRS